MSRKIKILFLKPLDPNLNGNNIILSYFEKKEKFKPGSMNIYHLADLTLLTLAGRLKKYGNLFHITHIDEDVDGLISGELDFDLIYINSKSQQSPRSHKIAELYRKRDSLIILGGSHVTGVMEDCLNRYDSLLIGEEDLIFDEMIEDFIKYGKEGVKKIYRNKEFLELDNSPPPAYELLNFKKYGMIPIQATRGCPHDCKFCFSTKFYGKKLRHKPVSSIVEEIKLIKKFNKTPSLFFMDDNMLSDRKYSMKLLKELKKENVRWCTFTDISFAHDEELLKLLPESGCSEVLIGFETVSNSSMNQVSDFKKRELLRYDESIRKIQEAGIGIIGSFVVGFDSDTQKTFDELFEFIDRNMLHEISISILTPYPGTELFEEFKNRNRLTTFDYGRYSDLSWNINYKPLNLSNEEIKEGIIKLLDRVYSKEMFIKRIKHLKKLAKAKKN